MSKIYVLQLEDDRYYVGKTSQLERRIIQHSRSRFNDWTKKYKLIDFIEEFEAKGPFDEDLTVLRYMKIHGIDSVRGGSFSDVFLSKDTKKTITCMLKNTSETCFRCGENHFSSECYTLNAKNKDKSCYQCGEKGHIAKACPKQPENEED